MMFFFFSFDTCGCLVKRNGMGWVRVCALRGAIDGTIGWCFGLDWIGWLEGGREEEVW